MPDLENAKNHYATNPPQLDFGGTEGSFVLSNSLEKLDAKEKERLQLTENNIILSLHENAHNPTPKSDKIFFIVKFDKFGSSLPTLLPLPPEMKGHEIHIFLYLGSQNFINMVAIGKGNSP